MANVHNDWLTNITFILYPNGVKNFEFYLSITPYAEPSGPSKSRAQYVVKFYHFPPPQKSISYTESYLVKVVSTQVQILAFRVAFFRRQQILTDRFKQPK